MAKYKQRKDGRYQTSVTIDNIKQYVSANSSDELDKKVTELKYLGNKGITLNNSDVALGDFTDKWLEIHSVGKEKNTIKEYKYIINHYIKPKLGHKKIKTLKKYDVEEIVASLVDEGHVKLAKKFLTYMKSILNDAVQNDIVLKNVATTIKSPQYKPKERKPLTDEEDRLLIKCAKEHKDGLFFLLIRFTGIRKQEAAAIEVNDIDIKESIIPINHAISFANNQGELKSTKNRKSRNVYILDIFREQLIERVEYCKKHKIKYLFTKQSKPTERLSDSAITNMCSSFLTYMNKVYKEEIEEYNKDKKENEKKKFVKIEFTIHQLRHSFCTMLYYLGIGIKEAQELMGHSSAKMVYDVYTHFDAQKRKTYEKLNNLTQKYL